ncbi:MAG: NUDIX domain-containing protein [archaeon]|nr:NUDIX domain-containing protein [archaeon]
MILNFTKIMLYSEKKNAQTMLDEKADLILLDEQELSELGKGKLEILDIYNENNERIGAASRKAYIKLGLITRAVHIFVFNKSGEVFLQKRSENKDTYPGFFAPSASGHIDLGEESLHAAKRELKEELGVNAELKFLGSFKCFMPENLVNQFYDFYMAVCDNKISANKAEIESGVWVSINELSNLNQEKFVPAMKHEIRLFLSDMKNVLKEM